MKEAACALLKWWAMPLRDTRLFLLMAAFILTGCDRPPAEEPQTDGPAPVLIALHPASAKVGQVFNVQPDGNAALGVDCKDVSGEASIVFGNRPLRAIHSPDNKFLSTTIPRELYSVPGKVSVYIKTAAGESNQLNFSIETAK
jgi:hypothetical protein